MWMSKNLNTQKWWEQPAEIFKKHRTRENWEEGNEIQSALINVWRMSGNESVDAGILKVILELFCN